MHLPRFRFSLRKLIVFVTVFAAALAGWPLLEQRATDDVAELAYGRTRDAFVSLTGVGWNNNQSPAEVGMPEAVLPYVVRVLHPDSGEMDPAKDIFAKTYKYYFWFFGLKVRLPFETEIKFE